LRTKAALLHLTGFFVVEEKLSLCTINSEKRKLKGLPKFSQSQTKLLWYRYTSTLQEKC